MTKTMKTMKTMTVKKIRNSVNDLLPNRVADGAKLFDPADDSHVSRTTPLQTKKRELENDPQYQGEAVNQNREKSTSRKRMDKETRPL